MYKFAEILNDLILKENISLRELANRTKVSSSQYSKYLKGTIPTIEIALRISNYFKCSLDFLFGICETNNFNNLLKNCDLATFLNRYEILLKKNNISHWKLCRGCELSESSLRRWRKGENPSMFSLIIIAKNLSCSIDYLIGRSIY